MNLAPYFDIMQIAAWLQTYAAKLSCTNISPQYGATRKTLNYNAVWNEA